MIPLDNTETKFTEESCFSDLSPEEKDPTQIFWDTKVYSQNKSEISSWTQTFLIKLYQVFN